MLVLSTGRSYGSWYDFQYVFLGRKRWLFALNEDTNLLGPKLLSRLWNCRLPLSLTISVLSTVPILAKLTCMGCFSGTLRLKYFPNRVLGACWNFLESESPKEANDTWLQIRGSYLALEFVIPTFLCRYACELWVYVLFSLGDALNSDTSEAAGFRRLCLSDF